MWIMIFSLALFTHSIMTWRACRKVWIAEVAAVGLIHSNVWPAATPSDGNCAMMPRLRWRGLLWHVEVEVEMEVTSFSHLPPTICHASILSSSCFYYHPPVLYFKGQSSFSLCFSVCLFFIHITSLIWIATNESSYLGVHPEEIRVSFIIPYYLLSSLPAKNSQGNYDKEQRLFHCYYQSGVLFP